MLFCWKLRTCAECGVTFKRDDASIRPDLCAPHRKPHEDRARLEQELFSWVRAHVPTFKRFYDYSLHQDMQKMHEQARHIGYLSMMNYPREPRVWLTTVDYEPPKE